MSAVSSAAAPGASGASLRHGRLSDELLARYAARSDRAFSVLYERYYQRLYRYCRSIVRDDVDAQDVLQSTFTRALAALRRDQRNAPLRPWLYRIAHNEAITLLRQRKRDAEQHLYAEVRLEEAPADEAASVRARWNALVEDMAALPERQRGALLLRELAGLSHDEIAVALGVSTGGAKQAIFEARQALAEVEEGRAMSCDAVRHQVSEGDRRVLRGRRIRAHLRDCAACEAFALGIDSRRHELRALAPALPPTAAAAVLARSVSAASPHGAASAAAGPAAATAVFGKAASTAVIWKALTGAAVLVTATAGVTGLTHVLEQHHASRAAVHHRLAPAALPLHRTGMPMLRPGMPMLRPGVAPPAVPVAHRREASGRAVAAPPMRPPAPPTITNARAGTTKQPENASWHRSSRSHGGAQHPQPVVASRGTAAGGGSTHFHGGARSAQHAASTSRTTQASSSGGSTRANSTHASSSPNHSQSLLPSVATTLGSTGAFAQPHAKALSTTS